MRIESNGEGKLRAACDRCHELNNRCTRTSGSESRCDRCERLDIDCVYNTSARIGRPKLSRPVPNRSASGSGSSDTHARHTLKRRAVQSGQLGTAKLVPLDHVDHVDHVDQSTGGSPKNLEPMPGFLDAVLLPEGMYIRNGPALGH